MEGLGGDKLFKSLLGSHVEKGLRLSGVGLGDGARARAREWTPRKPGCKSVGGATLQRVQRKGQWEERWPHNRHCEFMSLMVSD